MLGSIIGGALGIAGSIVGGIKQAKVMRQVNDSLTSQQNDNQAWYERRYNEDETQRAEAQRMLQQTRDYIKQRNQEAAGTAAVMGGTDAAIAQQKAANNSAISDTAAQIAASGGARKDAIERQYMDRDAAIEDSKNNLRLGKAQAIGTAINGVAQAGAGIANAIG